MVVICDVMCYCVVECSHVGWCINILFNGFGGDGGTGSAVPFPIPDRFGPNKNRKMCNTIYKSLPYRSTSSEHTPTGNLI